MRETKRDCCKPEVVDFTVEVAHSPSKPSRV